MLVRTQVGVGKGNKQEKNHTEGPREFGANPKSGQLWGSAPKGGRFCYHELLPSGRWTLRARHLQKQRKRVSTHMPYTLKNPWAMR